MMKTVLAAGIVLVSAAACVRPVSAEPYWDGYQWVERCGPGCQHRREERMREERWREHRWEERRRWEEPRHWDHPMPPPPPRW